LQWIQRVKKEDRIITDDYITLPMMDTPKSSGALPIATHIIPALGSWK
jgi:hypothetical protein